MKPFTNFLVKQIGLKVYIISSLKCGYRCCFCTKIVFLYFFQAESFFSLCFGLAVTFTPTILQFLFRPLAPYFLWKNPWTKKLNWCGLSPHHFHFLVVKYSAIQLNCRNSAYLLKERRRVMSLILLFCQHLTEMFQNQGKTKHIHFYKKSKNKMVYCKIT